MSSQSCYERELRGLLSSNDETLRKITKSFPITEQRNYNLIRKCPFLVIRVAGSLGEDIVALRGGICFPIEVKASKEPRFHFSNTQRLKKQQEIFINKCRQTNNLPIYAYRLKNIRGRDPWRLFTIETKKTPKNQLGLYLSLSKLKKTQNGNYLMVWTDGISLGDFIKHLYHTYFKYD